MTFTLIQDAIDTYTERVGAPPGEIVVGVDVEKKLFDMMDGIVTPYHLGDRPLVHSLFGIPVMVKDDCPAGMVYFLQKDDA